MRTRDDLARERTKPRSKRQHESNAKNSRMPGEVDRDRILYSSEFRRLAGITQVASVNEQHLIHNRLTHSLKVAQMGRRIAERLLLEDNSLDGRGLSPDAVEVAGLAHDLGHPPFGHAAERALSDLFKDDLHIDLGFEGNAQSFRIVTKISTRSQSSLGLDLTKASLAAILKYPQIEPPDPSPTFTDRSVGKKWGAYETELDDFKFAVGNPPAGKQTKVRSPNAVVMDWADDISFATHDLHDFIQAGMIKPESLVEGHESLDRFKAHIQDKLSKDPLFDGTIFEQAFDEVFDDFSDIPHSYDGSREHRAKLHSTINRWIRRLDTACIPAAKNPYVSVKEDAQYQAEILKHITTYHVVLNPSIRAAESGQEKLIRNLHRLLVDVLKKCPDGDGLPQDFLALSRLAKKDGLLGDPASYRAAADYICSLTESQAVDLHDRLSGTGRVRSLGGWIR